jgi:prolyl oligopeptidase
MTAWPRSLVWTLALGSFAGCASSQPMSTPSTLPSGAAPKVGAPTRSVSVYPLAPPGDVVEKHFGIALADPFRWLEELDSPQTRAWVNAENQLTDRYFAAIPGRAQLRARLAELRQVPSFNLPVRRGGRYFWIYRDGRSAQPVVMSAATLNGPPRVLFDPNLLSSDGSLAFYRMAVSDDGTLLAYGLSPGSGDWTTWHVRNVASGKDLPDQLEHLKYYDPVFSHDGKGLFYSSFPAPTAGKELTEPDHDDRVYFHRLGSPTSDDELVYARPDHPTEQFHPQISRDGRYLVITIGDGEVDDRGVEQVAYKDLARHGKPELLVRNYDAQYLFVGSAGPLFYFITTGGAANKRIVSIDSRAPLQAAKVVVPESKLAIQDAKVIGERLLVTFMQDAHSVCTAFDLTGRKLREVALPGLGSEWDFDGDESEGFYSFESLTEPATIYRYDFATGLSAAWQEPALPFEPSAFETKQIFFASKDGTRVPMFVTSKRGLALDGALPTLITGYGFGGVPNLPDYAPSNIAWLERGGVSVLVNIRGGGEYGEDWHKAAWREHRQTGFDDFIAAGQWLIANRYTSREHLGAVGTSGGGMLVAAVTMQRPDLFGASVPIAGVHDLLRFQLFGEGAGWQGDLGAPDGSASEFAFLKSISPLHNVRPGTSYPPMLLITADHDVRVAPLHSYKFAAALQAAQAGSAPIALRVDTQSGHGGGATALQRVTRDAEVLAFFAHNLGMKLP